MIPGWTHNIINLSDTEDLVTVMTCNEVFDPSHPDTFFEKVTLNYKKKPFTSKSIRRCKIPPFGYEFMFTKLEKG